MTIVDRQLSSKRLFLRAEMACQAITASARSSVLRPLSQRSARRLRQPPVVILTPVVDRQFPGNMFDHYRNPEPMHD